MDAIVTARVPVEIKEQANAILAELGSSPTKLINAAYLYVLKHRELPVPEVQRTPGGQPIVRKITPEDAAVIDASLEACKVEVSPGFWEELGDRSYKDYIAEQRWRDYEALG